MSGRRFFNLWGGADTYLDQIQSIAPSGLISHWDFDEESPDDGTTVFDKVGSNDGTIGFDNDKETISRVSSSLVGSPWALQFDDAAASDAYVKMPDSPDWDVAASQDVTINAWIRCLSSGGLDPWIVLRGNNGSLTDFIIFRVIDNNRVNWRVNTSLDDRNITSAAGTIVHNQLHMVTGVWDRDGNVELFIDADSKASTAAGLILGTIVNSNDLWLHTYDDGVSQAAMEFHALTFWKGVDTALTQSQIDDLYAAGGGS